MKGLSLLINIILLSCSTSKTTRDIPSWVQAIESGESSVVLELDKEYYFRAIYKTDIENAKVCDYAVDKAYEYVLNGYTKKEGIPYKVMVIFEIREKYSCAATISVKKKDLIALAELNDLKNKLAEKKSEFDVKVKRELDSIEAEKAHLERERERIYDEKEELLKYANQNAVKKIFPSLIASFAPL